MQLIKTPLAGVFEASTDFHRDHRGAFGRLFCADELSAAHGRRPIVQINLSRTREVGAVRGMHYQHPPMAEAKWVRCLRGRAFDVALDLRAGSATFLQWHAAVLDAEDMNAIFIPEGCAHGFQALEPDTELLYLHTDYYAPRAEAGVRWDDPRIGIRWPQPASDLSERDCNHPLIDRNFAGIHVGIQGSGANRANDQDVGA